MYMYVCLYMYVCMYMYACICMHVYVCMYVYVCVYVCMYMYVCVYAYMCMYLCITYWGNCPGEMSYPKREGELSGGNCPGRIVRGNCPEGELSYTRENWTIKKRDEERIEAFEMKCTMRKILRVSWTQKKTNECVLDQKEDSIIEYFVHVMRIGDFLEKEIMQGAVPGTRTQGRPKMRWIDDM